MKIAAFAQDRGACNGLRIRQPTEKIRKLGLAEAYCIGLADPKTDEVVKDADIVFVGRAGGPGALDMMKRLKGLGKKIVYDLDDSLFDISPFSPHYKDMGIMPVNMDMDYGDRMEMWVDGRMGLDIKHNRNIRRCFIEILKSVDAVTVTTPTLVDLYKRFNDRVRMVPNAIDFDLWRWSGVRHDSGKVRVIYPAGSNHQEDWFMVRPVLEKLQVELPDWTLVLMGVDWPGQWGSLDPKRVETTPWVDFDSHPMAMALSCGDIGIAPITEVAFNDYRSSLKWYEYSAIGAATVASNFGPYRRDCTDGVDALLCKTKGEWKDALALLITDQGKRMELADNALKKVKRDFNLDFVVDKWISVFNEVNNA